MKNYKCKKCKLTFDNKLKECPYCHKKRFSFKPIIFLLVIALIGCGAFYTYQNKDFMDNIVSKAKNLTNKKNVDGLEVTITNYKIDNYIYDIDDSDICTITMDFYNNSKSEKNINYDIQVYINGYLTKEHILHNSNITENLSSKMKMTCNYDVIVKKETEIKNIKVFYKDKNLVSEDGSEASKEYKLLAEYSA